MMEALHAERPTKPAVLLGLRLRCPNCGEGKLFKSYVKPVDTCATCGEDFTHQRADDGPAYIVILIVCHIIGFMLHLLFEPLGRDPILLLLALIPTAVILSLWMLPRVKGGLIAFQWAKRMHGFGR